MITYSHKLPQDIYEESLKAINNVCFSRREIDIISCLLSGRTAKSIGSLLSIAPRTVETHTRNIVLKLERSSREDIRNFIEKSGKLLMIREYYDSLLAQCAFEKCLRAVPEKNKDRFTCQIVYRQELDQKNKPSLIAKMEEHLKIAGITPFIEAREDFHNIFYINHHAGQRAVDYRICIVDESFLMEFQSSALQKKATPSSPPPKNSHPGSFLFLSPSSKVPQEISDAGYIDCSSQESYYALFFEVLKRIFPLIELDAIIADFKREYQSAGSGGKNLLPSEPEENKNAESWKSHLLLTSFLTFFKKPRWLLGSVGALSLVSILGLFLMFRQSNELLETQFRPDLSTPTLLNRPKLIAEINKKLEETDGIQTVALIGIGGAGKTTLANQYADSQSSSISAIINAETKSSLMNSFESLADKLCNTEEDKRILRSLQEIEKFEIKEEKLIQFVRNQLKARPNWLLIYDNVEQLTDNQYYFPSAVKTWGKGKVIITTQDGHIQNNSYVKDTLLIGALEPDEKLSLLMKIMNPKDKEPIDSEQQKSAKKFLEKVPSFPLDIAVAAYYMKATNTHYDKYLEYLAADDNQSFSEIQKNILKEFTGYTKTRYHIISISLDKIISVDKNFADLLLLVSFLDSKNIPRALLESYKGRLVVDNFIYHLKKFRLIDAPSGYTASVTSFSVQDSTQKVARGYLGKKLNLIQDRRLLTKTAEALDKYIEDCIDKEDYASSSILLSHTEAFLSQDQLLDDGIKQSLKSQLGGIYHYLGNYERAKEILDASLTQSGSNEHKGSLQKAKALIYLGNTYRSMRDYEKAKNSLEKGLLIYQKYFPENRAGIARASAYLGNIYKKLRDYEKAKNLLQESLAIYKRDLPKNQAGIARASAYLGNVYKELSMPEKAKALLEDSLAIYEKNFSENYVGICWIVALLGDVYRDLGDLNKARDFFQRSLAVYQKYLPENYIRVSWALMQLGTVYKDMGNYQEAKKCFEKVLASYQKHYGKNHIETALVLTNLGEIYSLEDDLDKAENHIKQSLDIIGYSKLPEKHKNLEILADIYFKRFIKAKNQGDERLSASLKQQAISYFNQALKAMSNHSSTNASSVQRIQTKLKKIQTESL